VFFVAAGSGCPGCLCSPTAPESASAAGGVNVRFVKRCGPATDETVFLPMPVVPMVRPVPERSVPTPRLAPMALPGGRAELIP
jgi:hypothetical protein